MIHQAIHKTGSDQRTGQSKTPAISARSSDRTAQRRSDGAPQPGHNFADVAVHRPDQRPAAHGQPQAPSNRTGLPDTLKSGVEQLAGMSLDDVRVHYNSAKPAQLDALAFAQGRNIHVAPGEECHLPHEAWHVVQQAQGRVQPTMQMKRGVSVNDDSQLEGEADRMGTRALRGATQLSSVVAAPLAVRASSQTEHANPVQRVKKKSLRARVREKLLKEGYGNLKKREVRFATLRNEKDRLADKRPKADELEAAKGKLKRADYGVVHPDLRGIRTRRRASQEPQDYTDHMVDTRRSAHRLMEGETGRRMLTEIDSRTDELNPGVKGDERKAPLTAVDIRSGRGKAPDATMSHKPRHDGSYSSVQRGYRYDGKSGLGQRSRINYDETAPRRTSFVSLGHEMVHAWRTAKGAAVSPPQISPQRDQFEPVLKQGDNEANDNRLVERVIANHAQQREEFETVGLLDTPRLSWAPTENMIRREHNIQDRQDYSRLKPGNPETEEAIRNIDEATDDRGILDYLRLKKSPVRSILAHLED